MRLEQLNGLVLLRMWKWSTLRIPVVVRGLVCHATLFRVGRGTKASCLGVDFY